MKKAGILVATLCLILIGGSIFFIFYGRAHRTTEATTRQPLEMAGNIEVKEVDVNVKVPGRVSSIRVEEGDEVAAGDELAVLEADNIEAKADLARAAMEAANAQYQKARNGARPQQLQQAKDLMDQAKAGYDLAKTTNDRLEYLYREGVLPKQKLDISRTELEVYRKKYNSAKEQYDMVKEGAQKEDVTSAGALVKQAQAAYEEVQSYLKDATVKAPIDGIITAKNVEPGELVSTGMPVVTISNLRDAWVEVKVQETAIAKLKLGQVIPIRVPAYPGKKFYGKVTFIGSKPSYATEKATQEKGDQDIVAYAVKLKIANDDMQLHPGMTALIKL